MEVYLLTLTHLLPLFLWMSVHTVLHECAHALVVKICGGTIEEFKPYPHHIGDVLVGGSVTFNNVPDRYNRLVAVAPYILDSVMIAVGLMSNVYGGGSVVDYIAEVVLLAAPMADTFSNLIKSINSPINDFRTLVNGSF